MFLHVYTGYHMTCIHFIDLFMIIISRYSLKGYSQVDCIAEYLTFLPFVERMKARFPQMELLPLCYQLSSFL